MYSLAKSQMTQMKETESFTLCSIAKYYYQVQDNDDVDVDVTRNPCFPPTDTV